MNVSRDNFNPDTFSFHTDPVLVVENFWSKDERTWLRDNMARAAWKPLAEMPQVLAAFPNCGNWLKAEIAPSEATMFLDRLSLTCIADYIESFPNITGRHVSFNYYSYAAGDCLLTHDDTVQPTGMNGTRPKAAPLRRLALITYLHDEWQADWGGELMIYSAARDPASQRPRLSVTHCIAPQPGSLVLFTVPRFHRVCRVDPMSGDHKRLSIAGWFMTEHAHTGQRDERERAGSGRSL